MPTLVLYPFRFRDPLSGTWVGVRHVTALAARAARDDPEYQAFLNKLARSDESGRLQLGIATRTRWTQPFLGAKMDVGLIGVVFVGVVIGLYFVFVFTTAGHRKKQIEVFKAFLTD